MRRADAAAVAAYRARHGTRISCGDGTSRELSMDAVATQPSIEGALADIRAWNEVERRDNHECHTLKLLELCLLPRAASTSCPSSRSTPRSEPSSTTFAGAKRSRPPSQLL